MNLKYPVSRLMRWKIKLSEYDYSITYTQGKLNCNANALSRIPPAIETEQPLPSHNDPSNAPLTLSSTEFTNINAITGALLKNTCR